MQTSSRKIAFFITEDWFFLSHRLKLAAECRDAGWLVHVATRVAECGEKILGEGFSLTPLRLRRGGLNPLYELLTFIDILRIMVREKPAIVHLVGLKLMLYGSIASVFFPRILVVSAVSGLGTLFTSEHKNKKLIRWAIVGALKRLLRRKRSWVIVQNEDDKATFEAMTLSDHTILIPGMGVDVEAFQPTAEPEGIVTVSLVARMIGEKGVNETVKAARLLKRQGVSARIRLIGAPDPENPTSIPEETLRSWHDEGIVEWNGHQEDIARVWKDSHIAVLPSYREGFPKALIEAMAMGRPVVTTDTIGCRDVIENEISGLLVPLHDAGATADALAKLIRDRDLRQKMGTAARKRTESKFSDTRIAHRTIDLYRRMLHSSV